MTEWNLLPADLVNCKSLSSFELNLGKLVNKWIVAGCFFILFTFLFCIYFLYSWCDVLNDVINLINVDVDVDSDFDWENFGNVGKVVVDGRWLITRGRRKLWIRHMHTRHTRKDKPSEQTAGTSLPLVVNPSSPVIEIHILLTALHTFLMELVRRICLNIKLRILGDHLLSSHDHLNVWTSSDNVKRNFIFVTVRGVSCHKW